MGETALIKLEPKLWFEKYPFFVNWRPSIKNQAITSFSVSTVDNEGQASALASHVSQTNGIQKILLTGGIADRIYTVTSEATLTDGSVFVHRFEVPVVNRVVPVKILQKHTDEVIDLGLFFKRELEADESIFSVVLWAIDDATLDSKDVVDDRGFDADKDLVSIRVRDGLDGHDYIVNVMVNTDNDYIYGDQLLLRIRNS